MTLLVYIQMCLFRILYIYIYILMLFVEVIWFQLIFLKSFGIQAFGDWGCRVQFRQHYVRPDWRCFNGSLLVTILANIFIRFHEWLLFEKFRKLYVYMRYVDDISSIFDSTNDAMAFFLQNSILSIRLFNLLQMLRVMVHVALLRWFHWT